MAPSIKSVERDAKLLAQWLRESGLRLTPLTLCDAPSLVRAFWENIGWHESFAELELVHPDEAMGRKRALETLAGWHGDDGGAFAGVQLPKRFRMVVQGNSGESFTVTNEDDGHANPMLAGVSRDHTKKLVKIRQRYLSRVSGVLIAHALSGMYQESICLSVKDVKQFTGKSVLPALGSGLRRIADGLILLKMSQDSHVCFLHMAFESFERLIEWQASLKGVRRMDAPLGGVSHRCTASDLEAVREAMTEVKSVRTVDEKEWKTVTGRLDGHWIVISYYSAGATVQVDPADRGVFAAMAARGCPIAHPAPMPIVSMFPKAKGGAPTMEEIRRASAKLSDLVDELCPAHAKEREPMPLEEGAPKALAIITEALGWSPTLDAGLPPPRAESDARLKSVFERWFSAALPRDVWGYERGDDMAEYVPKGTRFLNAGTGTIENRTVLYVDESSGVPDPPIMSRRASEHRPIKLDERASNYLFHRLVHKGCGRERSARIDSTVGLGEPLFPKVCPELVQLAEGVYAGRDVYFRSGKLYGAWVATLPTEKLALAKAPFSYRYREVKRSKHLRPMAVDGIDGFRQYANGTMAFGRIDDWPVWMRYHPHSGLPLRIWCADEAGPVVKAWVEARKGEGSPG
ncbi:MAG: hypothetical protein AB8I08_11745 [Sandaracinaceae bacterium]